MSMKEDLSDKVVATILLIVTLFGAGQLFVISVLTLFGGVFTMLQFSASFILFGLACLACRLLINYITNGEKENGTGNKNQ